jgi:CRISPR-associated endonuclease/helicase Cas3
MKPSRWPEYLNDILAKSADRGGETLAQHTWYVLERLSDLRRLRPTLNEVARTPNLWHLLFWTCLLHDFGKATTGFQRMLATKGKDRWWHRHEVISLACLDWIASGLSEPDQRAIVAAIVSHHKDASEIRSLYDYREEDGIPDPVADPLAELDLSVVSKLWQWIDECAEDWRQALGFPADEVQMLPLMPHDEALAAFQSRGAQSIHHWLKRYHAWVHELEDPGQAARILPILLRGLTTTADHLASSHLTIELSPIQEGWEHFAGRVLEPNNESFFHQRESAARSGRSALLVAPTGSGKTEAALYWALGDGTRPVPRIFYALPYQASMNAMHRRLQDGKKGFGEERVGIQHGRALQAMYASFANQAPSWEARDRAKLQKNINTLHARPIKVFSPYQMLKAVFQLRGFEGMLTDYAQAAFIFDEIHAYEPGRLALMLEMVRYLREYYQARFFVMSATFPAIIREKLADALALGESDIITADGAVFEAFRRHRLDLLNGELLAEGVARIVDDVRAGKTVLACVNTVKRAQALRSALLAQGLPESQIVLAHSRYIVRDRISREQEIADRCGLGRKNPDPFVLVATQVVEVSLNIDLDTIYTDPAPLEALLQRFGRVNRACKKGICPVHVYRQPDDGQHVYDPKLVQGTLIELEGHKGQEIDEAGIATWLDTIYSDPVVQTAWQEDYQRAADGAARVLRSLRPFDSDDQKEDKFEQMFDNVEVLPQCFERTYLDLIMKGEYIEASTYFVGINKQKYMQLRRIGRLRPLEDPDGRKHRWMVSLPYSSELGLQFDDSGDDPLFGTA